MAVTKIWRIKGNASDAIDYACNKDKTVYTKEEMQSLADVIEYAANEDKTEKKFFVSAINCSVAFAKDQFNTVKKDSEKKMAVLPFMRIKALLSMKRRHD